MSDARFTVLLPTGPSGPYTSDDLVQLLRTGKASPDDRVQDAVTHTATTLGKMVPDAEALAAEGARNRVRRSTSDRLPRVSNVPRPQRTPLPVQQAALAAQDESATAGTPSPPPRTEPATAAAASDTVRKLTLSVAMLGFAALVTWFTWSEISGLFASPPPPPPPLAITGGWTIAEQPGSPGTWTIAVDGDRCTIIGPDGVHFSSPAAIAQETPHFAAVTLSKPHPQFGLTINFLATKDGAIVMARGFEAKAQRSP